MFATRHHEHLQDRVEDALGEPGRQVVVYGVTGVGKTSLIRHLCRNRGIPYLRFECSHTFEDTLREALSLLLDSEEADRVIRTSNLQASVCPCTASPRAPLVPDGGIANSLC